jgi:peptidoglycan hydrolase-like protein with peptidoglycan-binding domain
VLNERRDIWFTAPCPQDMDLTFIATLQRALKARGYYTLPVTGEMNPATTEAVRRYQADRGLDSPILSLAATRQLGLATTAPE